LVITELVSDMNARIVKVCTVGWLLAASWTRAEAQTLPLHFPVIGGSAGKALPAESNTSEVAKATEPSDAASKRAENAELLRHAERRLESGEAADGPAAQEVVLHKTVQAILTQQEAVRRQIDELNKRKSELTTKLSATRSAGLDKRTPLSIIEFDRLKDDLAAEQARANLISNSLSAAKEARERGESGREKSRAKQRHAEDAFNSGKDGPNAAELATAFEQSKQAANLASETLVLRELELARATLSHEVQRLAVELRNEEVVRALPRVYFSKSDLDEQIAQIAKQEEAAKSSLSLAQTSRQAADERVRETQQQLDAAPGDPILVEKLASRRREVERWSDEIDLLIQQLPRLAQLRMAWGHRFTIASAERGESAPPTTDELREWRKAAQSAVDELAAEASGRIQRMADLRSELAAVADRADAAVDGNAIVVGFLNAQRAQLDEMLRNQQAGLMQIESSRRVFLKLIEEFGADSLLPTKLAAGALAQVNDFWNTKLIPVGEGADKEYITVESAVVGLVIFIVGWMTSRTLGGVLVNRFLKRLRLSKDANAAARYAAYYIMMFVVVLVALKSTKLPLTAFTILGSALAIGVGFGSQALVNNFIGGLIMLAERPIRLGERITFGDFDGVVEEVGFRSTKLRTNDDHLVTIPNSTLVNDSIENVARRRTIRRLLNLQIGPETSRKKLEEAVQAIRELLEEKGIRERIHPIVGFEELPPRVYFNDFNATSLNIQIVYWYAPPDWWEYMELCERINLRIMEEFDRLGVEFAFPSKAMSVRVESPTEFGRAIAGRSNNTERRNVA
jgi:potassium-dependent mechanosensitive channel